MFNLGTDAVSEQWREIVRMSKATRFTTLNLDAAQAAPLSPTPHNATAGDPGMLPGIIQQHSARLPSVPPAAELALRTLRSCADR